VGAAAKPRCPLHGAFLANVLITLPEHQLEPIRSAYERAVRARRRQSYLTFAVLMLLVATASVTGEVSLSKLFDNIGNFTGYFARIIPQLRLDHLLSDLGEWMWNIDRWGKLILDTLLMAYCGTLLGFLGGFALCFFATQNLMPHAGVRFAARRFLEFCRSVPGLVFALIFIMAFGLGEVAGVFAISVHAVGALGKLFTEVVENIDMKPVDGIKASGANWRQSIRYAVLPQVLPSFASYTLLRFEINVRDASVMGFVGAGGIGQDFLEAIRKFYYSDVSAILVLITITVFSIDLVTERLRHRLIGYRKP
jgi:phosphonate transport system permease protein